MNVRFCLGTVMVAGFAWVVGCGGEMGGLDEELGDPSEMGNEGDLASVSSAASAPPLSYLQVYKVYSTNGGTEILDPNASHTSPIHGGAQLRITTKEIGYACSRTAKLGSTILKELSSTAIIESNIVKGWYITWNADGYSPGNFSYQARSCNYPQNTMYDSVSIWAGSGGTQRTATYSASLLQGASRTYGPFTVKSLTNFIASTTGTGDADLYVKFGSPPTLSSYNCSSTGSTSVERCALTVPSNQTTAYVMMYGYSSSSSYTLTVNYVAP